VRVVVYELLKVQSIHVTALMEKIVKHDSWPIQPDILNPPLLRLTSRKPFLLDLQPVDIKSRWRHNWKSAQVVNFHLQSGNQVSTSLGNCGLCWTVFARNRDTAVPAEGNGDFQTLICVLVARPRWCPTLSNSVPLTKLNGLSRLHSADEDAVLWLTSYGSWHASDISVTETITETEIIDPALTETKTMLIYETEII